MKIRNNTGRGLFFTLAILLLTIPLILLVSFYMMPSQTRMIDTTSKIRCDEMHYFMEDVKKDLSRAGSVFGRRAAIYAIDHTIQSPGNPLANYTFQCGEVCGVDCDYLIHPENGSEAAIAELALCGTLNGTNVTYMINHTIKEWIRKIETRGLDKNVVINLTLNEIKVVQLDSWNFSIILKNEIGIIDETETCYYLGENVQSISNTTIIGLEDPLYTLEGEGKIMKYIYDCDAGLASENMIGQGSEGYGNFSGTVVLNDMTPQERSTYCSTTDVSDMVLVIASGAGACNLFDWELCFNLDSPATDRFKGVINEGPDDYQSFVDKCNITIPWLRDTGDLGLAGEECIFVRDLKVYAGRDYEDLNLTCYQASNASSYPNDCPVDYPDGPSFFDRLDGSYSLSERYVNQSLEHFNNSQIGIETIIDLYDLLEHSITPYWNATAVDYLYWQNVSGCGVDGVCCTATPSLRLDCPHRERYNLTTTCQT